MRRATFSIHGISSMAQGAYIQTQREEKETHDDHEKRTWRQRLHVAKNGQAFIPSFAIKNCLSEIAKFLSIQIPGKGKATYTKHFESGILVPADVMLFKENGEPIVGDEVEGLWMHVPSDGRRGGSKRVSKCFPIMREWTGTTEVLILDETITRSVFENHVIQAGQLIGLGSFRVRNNGSFGRFEVRDLDVADIEAVA